MGLYPAVITLGQLCFSAIILWGSYAVEQLCCGAVTLPEYFCYGRLFFNDFLRFAANCNDEDAFVGNVEGCVGFANCEGAAQYVVNVSVVVVGSVNGKVVAVDSNGEVVFSIVGGDTLNAGNQRGTPSDRRIFLVVEADGLNTNFEFAEFVIGKSVAVNARTDSDVLIFSDFNEAGFGVNGEDSADFARRCNHYDIVSAVGVVISVDIVPGDGNSLGVFVDRSLNVFRGSGSYDFHVGSIVPQELTESPVATAEDFAVVNAIHFSIVVNPAVAVLEAFAETVAIDVAKSFAAIFTAEATDGHCN